MSRKILLAFLATRLEVCFLLVILNFDGLKVGVAQKFADLFYKPSTSLKIEIDNVNRQLRIEEVI